MLRSRSAEGESVAGPAKGAADLEDALVEVDVLPTQREQLAAAHAGLEREDEQSFEAVACCSVQEHSGLLDGEGDDLDVCLAWWPDECHDISWNQAPSHGLGEGAVQDGVQVADRGGILAANGVRLEEAAWPADGWPAG